MIITLCSSTTFFDKLLELEQALIEYGHTVLLPNNTKYYTPTEDHFVKIHYNSIHDNFINIEKSNAIYVANYKKNGIAGYIGGNTLLEMEFAFYLKKPIYLLNELPNSIPYHGELQAVQPIIIGTHWHRLENTSK